MCQILTAVKIKDFFQHLKNHALCERLFKPFQAPIKVSGQNFLKLENKLALNWTSLSQL